jgi:hypothetical protein
MSITWMKFVIISFFGNVRRGKSWASFSPPMPRFECRQCNRQFTSDNALQQVV